jgi:predicted ATPase
MVIALRLWEKKTLRPSVNRNKGRDLQVAISVIHAVQKNRQEASDRIRTCKKKDKPDSRLANNNNNNNKRFNFLWSK